MTTDSPLEVASIVQAAMPDGAVQPFGDQLFQRLLRHRIVLLGQQVDDDLANRICAELVLLAAEDEKRDISLYINSPGGSVSAAWPSTTSCSTCRTTSPRT